MWLLLFIAPAVLILMIFLFKRSKKNVNQNISEDDARRFAQLLVAEIKMYNSKEVEEGLKNRDLYKRLKADIERARRMYCERVPESIGKDYFQQEVIDTLANGDPRNLGIKDFRNE